jgi:hypothetical protein
MFNEADNLMGDREALQGLEEYWLKARVRVNILHAAPPSWTSSRRV